MKKLFQKSALLLLVILLVWGVPTCCAIKLFNGKTSLFVAIAEQNKVFLTADVTKAADFTRIYPCDGCSKIFILKYNEQFDFGWMLDGRVGLVATTAWLPMHLWGYDEYTLSLCVPCDRKWYLALTDDGSLALRFKIDNSAKKSSKLGLRRIIDCSTDDADEPEDKIDGSAKRSDDSNTDESMSWVLY